MLSRSFDRKHPAAVEIGIRHLSCQCHGHGHLGSPPGGQARWSDLDLLPRAVAVALPGGPGASGVRARSIYHGQSRASQLRNLARDAPLASAAAPS